MARYKHIDTSPRFLAVDLERQLLPGTFEHALCRLIDREIDLSALDARYCNDLNGATAYPPAMLLKVVLFAYSRGIVGSRPIERACREHVTFVVLAGDSAPHFTTGARCSCARPVHCAVMRRSAFCSRSRGQTLAEVEAYRLGGKAQLLPRRLGTVPRRQPFHPDRGTHRKPVLVSSRQSIGPLQTTRQSSRTLHFPS